MLLDIVVSCVVCALAYAIKGGSGAEVFTNWNRVREKNSVWDRLLDGKTLSTIVMFLLALCYVPLGVAALIALGWLAAVAPSMGEEHGAVGDYKGGWGPYLTALRGDGSGKVQFGRTYGVKKAVQRGLLMGSVMTLVTSYLPFLVASVAFVPCVWAGQCLNQIILKKQGWTLSEPLIGAVLFGIPMGMFFAAHGGLFQ